MEENESVTVSRRRAYEGHVATLAVGFGTYFGLETLHISELPCFLAGAVVGSVIGTVTRQRGDQERGSPPPK
jgi:hypothetical protein